MVRIPVPSLWLCKYPCLVLPIRAADDDSRQMPSHKYCFGANVAVFAKCSIARYPPLFPERITTGICPGGEIPMRLILETPLFAAFVVLVLLRLDGPIRRA